MGNAEIVALLSLILLLFGWRNLDTLGPGLVHAIEEIKNHLGGGPQPPSHPLPGNDSVVVNRRRSRQ
jgi:Sec-independent protein translocase protein TatA